MKVIVNLTDRQLQKAMILAGLKDAEIDKINDVLPKYPEIDITGFLANNDKDGYANLAFASFVFGAIAEQEGK